MANYPCDPIPHLPPGDAIIEPHSLRCRRTYHYLGGAPLVASHEWAIITLAPLPDPAHYDQDILLICHCLEETSGWRFAEVSRSGMGAALVRFASVVDIDTAISQSPFFVGDSTLSVTRKDHGINFCDCTFSHDAWIMMVNYPLECQRVEKERESVSGFGNLLAWNMETSNRARILVKLRVPELLEIPVSHVICDNLDDVGHGQSWTCVVYIIQQDLLGAMGGDEDPIPPDGNVHPLPHAPFGGVWHDAHFHGHEDDENLQQPHNDYLYMPHVVTPPQSHVNPHGALAANMRVAVEATDCFIALHNMIKHAISAAPYIPDNLSAQTVSGIRCQIIDVDDALGVIRKGVMTVTTIQEREIAPSQCFITEIMEECSLPNTVSSVMVQNIPTQETSNALEQSTRQINQSKNRKQKAPIIVAEVRRSKRIVGLSAGFKDQEAATKATRCKKQDPTKGLGA